MGAHALPVGGPGANALSLSTSALGDGQQQARAAQDVGGRPGARQRLQKTP